MAHKVPVLDLQCFEPNRWPREISGFKDRAYMLFRYLDELGKRVLQAIHYPPIIDRKTPAVRAAKHEDINLITLLIGSSEEGLQILSRDGGWIPVTSIPGTSVLPA